MNDRRRTLLALPYIVWMIGFTIIPLALIFVFGLQDRNGAFTLENVLSIFERDHMKALRLSLELSILSTVICLVLAFPLAMILREKKVGRAGFITFVFILPMWMNFLLRTLAWQTLLEKNGVINGILKALNLPTISIINTPAAIVLGMVYNFLPFMILPVYNTMCKIDDSIIEAARDLGASFWQTITKILFPLSVPGIVSGITMVFVPALTTFVISNILGGSKILLIGNVIETEFTKAANWNLGSGLSIIMMIFILASMAVLSHFDKSREGTAF